MNTVTNLHDADLLASRREPRLSGAEAVDCLAIINDNQTLELIGAVCEPRFPLLKVRDGGSREAMEILAGSSPPNVLILDVSDTPKPLTAIMPIVATFADGTKIIAIGSVNDIGLYHEMIESGAIEYLVKPVGEKALLAALARLEAKPADEPRPAAESPAKRNVVAVLGTRGGVGSSTVAVNCAWLIANEHKQRTTLLDLDLQNGTVALALDVEPTRGLREALENPARIDSLFIGSAAVKVGERLSILAAEEGLADDMRFDSTAIDLLIEELHRHSDCIVIDVPRTMSAARGRVLAAATDVIVVSDLSLAGLRDAIRLHGAVQKSAPEARIRFLVNRAGAKDAIAKAEFEKALGRKVDFMMPEDNRLLVAAANKGKPIAALGGGGKIGPVMRALVATMFAPDSAKKPKGFWRRSR